METQLKWAGAFVAPSPGKVANLENLLQPKNTDQASAQGLETGSIRVIENEHSV